VRQAILVLGFVVSLSALGINTSPILALIGGAAFVIGLALQGTLSNFAQGLLILAYRPFDVGDVIDAGGVSGIVDSMNMLSTTIRTFDNKKMIVPNGKIGGDTITNATASSTRRIDMTFGIGYDDDVAKAQLILERIINEHPLVMKDPAPLIKMNELGESAINFIARPWAKTGDYWTVFWEVTAAVKEEFDSTGISFPYPQQDVHLYQVKEK
jgi:small conductance mechanosensitive channel